MQKLWEGCQTMLFKVLYICRALTHTQYGVPTFLDVLIWLPPIFYLIPGRLMFLVSAFVHLPRSDPYPVHTGYPRFQTSDSKTSLFYDPIFYLTPGRLMFSCFSFCTFAALWLSSSSMWHSYQQVRQVQLEYNFLHVLLRLWHRQRQIQFPTCIVWFITKTKTQAYFYVYDKDTGWHNWEL